MQPARHQLAPFRRLLLDHRPPHQAWMQPPHVPSNDRSHHRRRIASAIDTHRARYRRPVPQSMRPQGARVVDGGQP